MKFKTYIRGGNFLRNFSSMGGRVNNFISLKVGPPAGDWAIRKDETDAVFQNLSCSAVTSGTFPSATFASLIGGDLSALSSTTVKLKHTSLHGTFSKISVNTKGLVDGGFPITASDVPSLDWAKITSGKPTAAGGYGITDALLSTGGSISANITLSALVPTQSDHAASKGYVDAKLVILAAPYIKTGDIVVRSTASSYSGYLRCNGGIVSKTAYANLYAALGASFSYDTNNFKLPDLTASETGGPGVGEFSFFIRT